MFIFDPGCLNNLLQNVVLNSVTDQQKPNSTAINFIRNEEKYFPRFYCYRLWSGVVSSIRYCPVHLTSFSVIQVTRKPTVTILQMVTPGCQPGALLQSLPSQQCAWKSSAQIYLRPSQLALHPRSTLVTQWLNFTTFFWKCTMTCSKK